MACMRPLSAQVDHILYDSGLDIYQSTHLEPLRGSAVHCSIDVSKTDRPVRGRPDRYSQCDISEKFSSGILDRRIGVKAQHRPNSSLSR